MESAIGFAMETVCCISAKLCQQINHLTHLGADVEEMQRLCDTVKAGKDDISDRLQRQGLEAFEVVKTWMAEAQKIERTVELHKRDYDLHKRCLFGCCPDCLFMLRLSSRVNIQGLQKLSEGGKLEPLGQVPPAIELVPVAPLVGQTPQKARAMIQGWLADNKTTIIGISGVGGVGKTSLVETINNNPNLKSWFEVVIFVAVSQRPDPKLVQDSIAARLGLCLPESSEERRRRLFNYLQKKRYLLILDDLWEKIDLYALGVGVPSVGGGAKIVFTTRDGRICRSMEADQSLELKTLSEQEGWELFCRKAHLGDGVIEDAAKALAAHCGGLPLAINCIATAMRGENDIWRWKTALDRLASGQDTSDGGLPAHLKSLKLSYDFSPQHLKPCFLDCALYRSTGNFYSFASKSYSILLRDKVISADYNLIPTWVAEGLLGGRDGGDIYDQGHAFINVMRDRSFIQAIDSPVTSRCGYVKVHDVLHALAIQIGTMERTCLYGGGSNEIDFPFQKAEPEQYEKISLVETEIVSLSTDFKSQTLTSLVLPALKVLDLQETIIESLPSSLATLKHLTYLNLSSTNIKGLPDSTGHLTCLQFLDLQYCEKLTSLPLSLSELKSLKSLLLFGCKKMSVLRREMSRLTSLEILTMTVSNIFIGEGNAEMENNEICMKDLSNLRYLRALFLQVKSPIVSGLMGSWRNMRELWFDCTQTDQKDLPEDMQAMNRLEALAISNCNAISLPDWICKFKYLNFLVNHGWQKLTELSELRSLPSLRVLGIEECNLLRGLDVEGGSVGGFQMLQRLSLRALPSLETLVGPRLEGEVMPNLKQLMVLECDELKTLPSGMEKLQKLEEIRGTADWWEEITCESHEIKNHLQKFYVEWAD